MLKALRNLFFIYTALMITGTILGIFMNLDLRQQGFSTLFVEEKIEDTTYSYIMIIYIIIFSFLVIFIASKLSIFIRLLEYGLLTLSSLVVFYLLYHLFFPVHHSLIASSIITSFILYKRIRKAKIKNISASLMAVGGGIILGNLFSFEVSLVLSLLLVAYDIIAVFITRHMLSLANIIIKHNLALTISSHEELPKKITEMLPKTAEKEIRLDLGTGDIVVPLMLIISSLSYSPFLIPNLLLSSIIGFIVLSIFMIMLRRPLPALPFLLMPIYMTILLQEPHKLLNLLL